MMEISQLCSNVAMFQRCDAKVNDVGFVFTTQRRDVAMS